MRTQFIILSLFTGMQLHAQPADQFIREGNELYKQQQYEQAEGLYSNAVKKDPSGSTAKFNLANTRYRRGKQDEAILAFDEIAIAEKDALLRAKAYYNKGVVLSRQQKTEESIEAYKSSLRQNPGDREARENLQKALLLLKKKNPPPEKEDKPAKKKQQPEQQQKQKQQPKMSQKESEQKLRLLAQKEKEVQKRLQKEKAKTGGSQSKDW